MGRGYKDRVSGSFYRPQLKYSHNMHRDAELEDIADDIADLAIIGVKLANPAIGEKLDNVKDTIDIIKPRNPINGGGENLKVFDNMLFHSMVPTKAKLNSALRNQSILNSNNNNNSSVILNSNMVNNNFVNQMTTNAMNILNNPPTMRPPKRR